MRARSLRAWLIVAVVMVDLLARPVHGLADTSSEFAVAAPAPFTSSGFTARAAASDGHGHLVVWGSSPIWATVISASGHIVNEHATFLGESAGWVGAAWVGSVYVVVVQSELGADVDLVRLDESGRHLSTSRLSDQGTSPTVAAGFVAWRELTGQGATHIRLQRLRADGTLEGDSFPVDLGGTADLPTVVASDAGAVLIWQRSGIRGSRLAPDGSLLDPDGYLIRESGVILGVDADGPRLLVRAKVALGVVALALHRDGSGVAEVARRDGFATELAVHGGLAPGGGFLLYLADKHGAEFVRVDTDGRPDDPVPAVPPAQGVNVGAIASSSTSSAIAWNGRTVPPVSAMRIERFDASLRPIDSAPIVPTRTTTVRQTEPIVAFDGTGLVATWSQETFDRDAWTGRVGLDGSLPDGAGIRTSTGGRGLVASNSNGSLVAGPLCCSGRILGQLFDSQMVSSRAFVLDPDNSDLLGLATDGTDFLAIVRYPAPVATARRLIWAIHVSSDGVPGDKVPLVEAADAAVAWDGRDYVVVARRVERLRNCPGGQRPPVPDPCSESGESHQVFAMRVNGEGLPVAPAQLLASNAEVSTRDKLRKLGPPVVASRDENTLAAWVSTEPDNSTRLVVSRLGWHGPAVESTVTTTPITGAFLGLAPVGEAFAAASGGVDSVRIDALDEGGVMTGVTEIVPTAPRAKVAPIVGAGDAVVVAYSRVATELPFNGVHRGFVRLVRF